MYTSHIQNNVDTLKLAGSNSEISSLDQILLKKKSASVLTTAKVAIPEQDKNDEVGAPEDDFKPGFAEFRDTILNGPLKSPAEILSLLLEMRPTNGGEPYFQTNEERTSAIGYVLQTINETDPKHPAREAVMQAFNGVLAAKTLIAKTVNDYLNPTGDEWWEAFN